MQVTLPKVPKIKEQNDNRAVFEIEELFPGYGVTLGNALRRVLYSSLPGAAITQVKIKGASHEFSTLPGVLEDVLEITLNLKQVYFKLHTEEPQIAKIKVRGAKKITAKDIDSPSQLEVSNKEAHIATLTKKNASFEAEITVEAGLGYVSVEQRKSERAEVGAIALDAIFTPMKKVNFEVDNMRVGDRTDYNRLRLDVETNGTISPQEALAHAADLLVQHFQIVKSFEGKNDKKSSAPKKPAKKAAKTKAKTKTGAKAKAKASKAKSSAKPKKAAKK